MKPDPVDSPNLPLMVFKVNLSTPLKLAPWRLTIAIMPCWSVVFGDFDRGVEGTLQKKFPDHLRHSYHSTKDIIEWIAIEYSTRQFQPHVYPLWKEYVKFRPEFPYERIG